MHGLRPAAHAIDQDFRPAAGQTAQAGSFQSPQNHFDAQGRYLGDVPDFRRTETVHVEGGKMQLDAAEQIFIPIDFQIRIHPALQEDLVAAQADRLFDFAIKFIVFDDITLAVAGRAIKRAKATAA